MLRVVKSSLLKAYAVVHNVEGLSPGVYHYGVEHHTLAQVKIADLRDTVVQQGLMQEFLGQCNVVIFLSMIMQRMRPKYQDRSYRYGLIEAGHLGQNIYLAATSMGLGACAIGRNVRKTYPRPYKPWLTAFIELSSRSLPARHVPCNPSDHDLLFSCADHINAARSYLADEAIGP